MKNLVLLLIVIIPFYSFAQTSYPGEQVELLEGKQLKVLEKQEKLQKLGYKDFYVDSWLEKIFAEENHSSEYGALVGKIFTVEKIIPFERFGRQKYKLRLSNSQTGTIYYAYDPKFSSNYPFEVIGGLAPPDVYFCSKIETKKNKVSGETKSRTPTEEGITFTKIDKEGETNLFLSIREFGPTLNVGSKGLLILLEDGKKIEKPEAPIEVEKDGANYIYSAFIELTDEDIQKLLESPMTHNRLYVYHGKINNGELFQEYLRCLTQILSE
ncbi:hypothetical protein LB467_03135 [Salegentibacter sp. JZCK2]|uniref:hypothetical protein n=1 Tax=Salegentibacter tibetensis TaxID=2873600 RepID=UPI001CCEB697|nr:hypothetical protein [Salegentibacter tibetensis]MBZ9728669.1 hypothetical protein [Salegentibacter tibetensis]